MKPVTLQQQVEEHILTSYESLYRLAFTYVKNPDDAMDVVQESVYKAISRAAELRDTTTLQSWLCRITVNTALDLLRKRARETTVEELPEVGREDVYQDADTLRALDVLDERERTVVVLRYFQDLKLQDIAQILDENLSTVKTILYRSLKKMKITLLEGEIDHERTPFGGPEDGVRLHSRASGA